MKNLKAQLMTLALLLSTATTHAQNSSSKLVLFSGSYSESLLFRMDVSISHVDGALFLQLNGRQKVRLNREGPNQYTQRDLGLQIIFTPNKNGDFKSFEFSQRGVTMTFTRTEILKSNYQRNSKTIRPNGLADAIIMDDLPSVSALIQAGADVNELDDRYQYAGPNGRRPLNWAALMNNTAIMELLLSSGAEINGVNLSGYTALHHAAEAGSVEAAKLLISKGADTQMKTNKNHTAIEIAAISDNRPLTRILKEASQ